LKVHNSINM